MKDKIGQLRHTCTFLTPQTSTDENGAEVITWSEGSAVWCALDYQTTSNEEQNVGARIHAMARVIVTLRFNETITEKMRIKFDEKEHNILAIIPNAHRSFMQIECVQDKPE